MPSPFTESQKQFIRDNYEKLTAQQLANKFKKLRFQVYNFIQSERLEKTEMPKEKPQSEFFVVEEMGWIV